ncbi:MAG: helix-turn-helix transcriptional regulator [Oscillospiraceae bacterium]|nr:helix-turn-helix transcriptional regulator [Oscillospiraceae bacterium]
MEIYDFGTLLRELRQKEHMTQKTLGERLGLTKTAISKYENGTASPSLEMLKSLSTIFHVSTDYLCGIEKAGTVSVNYLSVEQVELVKSVVGALQRKNSYMKAQENEDNYSLIGRIVTELTK